MRIDYGLGYRVSGRSKPAIVASGSEKDWPAELSFVPTATAILDRFLSRAELIQIVGKSYRLKDKACKPKGENGKEKKS